MSPKKKKQPAESTRACILRSAKCIFSRLGFEGASVKAIASDSKSNVALVSYYFGGKEGLYQACLEEFGKSRSIAFHTILTAPQSATDFKFKLRLWMESFFQAHLEDPEIVRIFHREIVEELRMDRSVFEKYFVKIFEDRTGFIVKARKGGFIRQDVEPYFAATFLLGAMGDSVR
ncbi:MAG: TetR family transcriptional regulator, partial [Bdellovibrionales bacterium]|nr:TetR family transcriptional regulator [Bdellovibrionales bacterium]